MSETLRPFCSSPAARAAFDAWRTRVEALGIVLSSGDTYLVGQLAARQLRYEDLQQRVELEQDAGMRLRLVESERRASVAFQAALEVLDRALHGRVAEAEEQPVVPAAVAGGARVLRMPARPKAGSGLAKRLKGPEAVQGRILLALSRADGPLTRVQLRKRVPGDETTFLRTLAALVESGEIARSGAGVRGRPHVYASRAAS